MAVSKNNIFVYFSLVVALGIFSQVETLLPPSTIIRASDAPFMVYVRNTEHYCGGVILSERIVLTACHCLSDKAMIIIAGRSHKMHDSNAQTVAVQRTLAHENYLLDPNGIQAYYDIGLLYLEIPFTFNDHVQSIQWTNGVDYKKNAIIYGWGSTDPFRNRPSFYLRAKNITLVPDELCIEMLNRAKTKCTKQIYELCAHKCACHGDSGSPIVQSVGNQTKLIGITSWLADDNISCDSSPTVFESVGYFSQWIKDGMKALMKPNATDSYLLTNYNIKSLIKTNTSETDDDTEFDKNDEIAAEEIGINKIR